MNTDNQTNTLKFNLKKILIILVIAVVLIIGIIVSFSIACRPYDKTNNQYVAVEIKENYSLEDIADKLHKKHIIGSENKFVKLTNMLVHGKKYKAGTYYLSPAMDFRDISRTMINGISTNEGFVLPSGYTVEQTAKALEQAGLCSKDEFMEVALNVDFSSYDFIDNSIYGAEKLQGYLFPTKYKAGDDANAAMIVMNMLNEFDIFFTAEYRERAEELGLSIRDIVTIASMIENETSIVSEMGDISSVIHNKLNLDMDFEGGFPDGPLCSPSSDAIKAALYPIESENVYYVMSDKLDGSHVFTADKKEYKDYLKAYKAAVKAKKSELKAQEKAD